MSDEKRHDRALGIHQPICRRDFLNSTLLATGGVLLGPLTPQQLIVLRHR